MSSTFTYSHLTYVPSPYSPPYLSVLTSSLSSVITLDCPPLIFGIPFCLFSPHTYHHLLLPPRKSVLTLLPSPRGCSSYALTSLVYNGVTFFITFSPLLRSYLSHMLNTCHPLVPRTLSFCQQLSSPQAILTTRCRHLMLSYCNYMPVATL